MCNSLFSLLLCSCDCVVSALNVFHILALHFVTMYSENVCMNVSIYVTTVNEKRGQGFEGSRTDIWEAVDEGKGNGENCIIIL